MKSVNHIMIRRADEDGEHKEDTNWIRRCTVIEVGARMLDGGEGDLRKICRNAAEDNMNCAICSKKVNSLQTSRNHIVSADS